MTPVNCNYVRDWLIRVDTQYDEATPKKIKAADYDRARQSLGLGSNVTNNYFFSSPQPAYGLNIGNSNTTNVYNPLVDSSKSKDKNSKTEEEKTNWKGIAAIGFVSTVVAGISIFVYARLSKAAEGARNYLKNTKAIHAWSMKIESPVNSKINKIAQVQKKIDQRALDKITNYKYSILTSLVGTLAIAGGGITILAAAPALATAATTAAIAGGILNSIAVMYAAYNCGMHWSDEKDGEKEFAAVKKLITDLITDLIEETPPSVYSESYQPSAPPSYDESEAAIAN